MNEYNHADVVGCMDSDFYKGIMEQARDIILVVAIDGSIIDANQAAVNAYGYSIDELRRMNVRELRSPETRMTIDNQLRLAQQEGVLFRTVYVRRDGTVFPAEVGSRRIRLPAGEVIVSMVRDITELIVIETALQEGKENFRVIYRELVTVHEEITASNEELRHQFDELLAKEEALELSEAKHRAIFEGANDGIYIRDLATGDILDMNQRACELGGYSKEEILSQDFNVVGTGEAPYSKNEARQWLMRAKDEPQLFEWQYKHKDGHFVWVEVNLKRTLLGREECTLAIVRDISERKIQEQTVRRMAYYDALTGLPNRAHFKERLEQELEKASRGEAAGAILFIDMDDLKMINDTLGHSYGDGVIIKAGAYLFAEAEENAMVARIGGDEFIVWLLGESERERVANIAENILNLLSRDYEMGTSKTHMTASIGIALYPADGTTVGDILKHVDLALYAAKDKGKNTWCFYEPHLKVTAFEDMILKRDLREAIERQELYLHYQPIVNSRSRKIVAYEALLRWRNPVYGLVPPNRFIALAEESNIIHKIGNWVLTEACQLARKLADMGKSDIRVSVNVSPRQLVADDFVTGVCDTIRDAGIKPEQIEIEITENALVASLEDSTNKLAQLRAIGVNLALDDFGTGYSSLTYLRNLPASMLKIDKSFIDTIMTDEIQLPFIRSIIHMAHVLRIKVVAEGVETQAQWEKLVQCQCDFIQGYFISRPVPEQEAILLLDHFGTE